MKIQLNPDAQLSLEQLEQLRDRLVEERRTLTESIASQNEVIEARRDCGDRDAADVASLEESGQRASVIADHHRATIAEIDAALGRMRDGRYGLSETTGEPIAFERLMLIPWARGGSTD